MSSNSTPSRRLDYHVHPEYSIDATGSIEAYCQAALDRGVSELCFTTHHDADPQRRDLEGWVVVGGQRMPVTGPYLRRYAQEVRQAAARFGPRGLVVRLGFEVGWWPGAGDEVARITDACRPDYLLGSVHWMGEYCVADLEHTRQWLGGPDPGPALAGYYRENALAAASGWFDCLGHLDVFRRTLLDPGEDHLDLPAVREAAWELLRACAATGTGIEVNTRHAALDPRLTCPGPRLLRMAVEAGVRTVVTGSDAHLPSAVGSGLATGAAAASAAGLAHLTGFRGRRPVPVPLAGAVGAGHRGGAGGRSSCELLDGDG